MGGVRPPHAEVYELIEEGDRVAVAATIRARGKRSGVETSWETWQVWTFRAGKFVRGQGFTSREGALGSIGRCD